MPNRLPHTITLRLNDRDYDYLNEIIVKKEDLQADEGINYSISDILRIAIHYMHEIEIEECWTYDRSLDTRFDENGNWIKDEKYDRYGNWKFFEEAELPFN